MKTTFSIVFFLICTIGFAQSSVALKDNPKYIEAKKAYDAQNYTRTIELGNQILDNYYLLTDVYALIGKAYLFSGKNAEAAKYLKIAHELEPIYDEIALFYIVASAYSKDYYPINQAYYSLSFFGMAETTKEYNNSYIDGVIKNLSSDPSYVATIETLAESKNKYNAGYRTNATIFGKEAVDLYLLPTKKSFEINANEITIKLMSLKKRLADNTFPTGYYNQLLVYVAKNAIDKANEKIIADELFAQFKSASTTTFMRYKIYEALVDIYQINRQYDDEISISNIMFDDIKKVSFSTSMNVKPLNRKMFAFNEQGKYKEALEVAKLVEPSLSKLIHPQIILESHLEISKAYNYNGDKAKALQIAEKGEELSKKFDFQNTSIGQEITRNLNRIKESNGQIVEKKYDINGPDYLAIYNDGMGLVGEKKYNEAIPFFEKSKSLYKKLLDNTAEKERSAMLLFYSKVGGNLIACYQETKQFDKIFPIMEELKANNLVSKNNSKNTKIATLKEVQNTLKTDEALVYYTEISRGTTREGTYIAAVITKDSYNTKYVVSHGALMNIYVRYNNLIGEIENEMAEKEYRTPKYTKYKNIAEAGTTEFRKGEVSLLIELYRKFLNPNEGGKVDSRFTNEMDFGMISNSFFIDYISKLEPFFKNKKKIIFALDGMQNLIPFESLVDMKSVYMIEKYDIAYTPSGSLLKEIRERKPNVYTKNILAFGDATYSKLQSEGMKLNSLADIDRLKNQVIDLQAQNKPLDYAFATFSKTAMSYLHGAKAEVEYIGKNIVKSDIKMGESMTENEFKRMSNTGELKNYKVIHLSSHAMVHPFIFELSSIAFNVYPTPKDNEDGMLTVHEMEKLNIKTDFMMLSACQTGLGKIVPGEGISGLNQAMLDAGANSTLSTLWSVNDYGSYIFTANLYKKVFIDGMDYLKAVSEVKRDFIKGNYDTDNFNGKKVMYWSPFIYNGK